MAITYHDPQPGDEPSVMAEMNITPLIDVMLVLLVMLIITIPIQLHAVNVEMPVGPPPPVIVEPVVVVIGISAGDRLSWNGEPLPDQVTLLKRLQDAAVSALRSPDVQGRLKTMGATAVEMDQSKFASQIAADLQRNKALLDKLGVKPE